MEKKRIYLVVLLVLIIGIVMISAFIISMGNNNQEKSYQQITGEVSGEIRWKSVTGGSVTGESVTGESVSGESISGELVTGEFVTGEIAIQEFNVTLTIGPYPNLTIIEPENRSYSFDAGDNYTFYLNVSANLEIETWWFTLIDLTNSLTINNTAYFLPNETFNAVAFSNQLRVYGNNTKGMIHNNNVTFYINVQTAPPYFEALDTQIFVCEASALNYNVSVTDFGGETLTPYVIPSYSLFYPYPSSISGGTNVSFFITSGTLNKEAAGGPNAGSKSYEENISITDGGGVDSQEINITIIEINNAPTISPIENQSLQTDENTTFSYQITATDQEDGDQESGNLSFNVSIIDSEGASQSFFSVNSTGGINFDINSSIVGTDNLTICVEDNNLTNPHSNITNECNTNGTSLFACTTAILTITEEVVVIEPTPSPSGGGGGGSIPKKICTPKWVCEPWDNCETLEKAFEVGLINESDSNQFLEICSNNNWNEVFCGIQTRRCKDLKNCNTTYEQPGSLQECYFTIDPSCEDGIKNCHDGSCELLVDCGGPCPTCPTCSDEIQNQNEEGIDCGGPCPWDCKIEKPLLKKSYLKYLLLIILLILLILIIKNAKKIVTLKKKLKEIKLYQIILILIVLSGLFFYIYPKYKQGDFVFSEGKDRIGEIKDASLTDYVIRWQDGTFSKESRFRVEGIRYLDERDIIDTLRENNQDELSFYTWDKEGEILTQGPVPKEESPEIFSLNLNELQNLTTRIGEEKCNPKLICGAWGECETSYNFDHIDDPNLIQDFKKRSCKDSRRCVADFIQTRKCEKVEPVRIEKRTERGTVYIDLYNSNNDLAFQLREEESEGVKKLYIELFIK